MKDEDPLADTKRKVEIWAYCMRGKRADMGFPPHSWEGRAQERGGSAPNPTASRVLPTNNTAEEVERHMVAMPKIYLNALIQKHLWSGTDKQRCKYLHCGMSAFKDRLNRGYAWLHGKMSA